MKILFPEYDAVGIEQSKILGLDSDDDYSHDNILSEIEECKYQTTLIQEQTTAKGQKRWDLPKIKGVVTEGIKLRLKKDHFTSLLLANDAARNLDNQQQQGISTFGGYSSKYIVQNNIRSDSMYQGKGMRKMKGAQRSSNISMEEGRQGNIAY
jgi:hypothetical protein